MAEGDKQTRELNACYSKIIGALEARLEPNKFSGDAESSIPLSQKE